MKYRLLKDCPHGKKDSVWVKTGEYPLRVFGFMQCGDDERMGYFPASSISSWFEEITEMKLFTKEQRAAITIQLANEDLLTNNLSNWLDEHTEK